MMDETGFTTNVGDYLIIMLTGRTYTYIAEVTQSTPLEMKVLEGGPLANLKAGDYILMAADSRQYQLDRQKNTEVFFESCQRAARQVISGLRSLGVTDNQLHEIWPG